MEGTSNPTFVDDSNQVTVIHTNPDTSPPAHLHESKSVPSIIVAPDYDEVVLVSPTAESLDDVSEQPAPIGWTTGESQTTLAGEYGSKIVLVDDSSAKAIESNPPTYDPPPYNGNYGANIVQETQKSGKDVEASKGEDEEDEANTGRDQWGKDIEFLLSCIAMSVGLGNVWRFPFVALENGGGAFVIPYIIVLIIVGKPMYYLEMLMGQFSSRGSVKVYDLAPAMRGTGISQVLAIATVTTYYTYLMGLCLKYIVDSFNSTLPWSECRVEWGPHCLASSQTGVGGAINNQTKTSAELYFVETVLREKENINDGLGMPNWELVLYLAISWTIIALLLIKGVKSSGKASYFLAIFPYVVLGILFIRAVTLPGAMKGLEYFFKPQWKTLLNPDVWYNACTQVFFSLSVGFGNVIMYSSYNKFRHNVSRDATIITTIDTITSLLAGSTVFGILGHLAYKVGTDDVGSVVKGGPGLAFISYPDAIAKFDWAPQLFSVLFFFMLYVLGVGSNIAMTSCITTIFKDYFKGLKNWIITTIIAVFMFCVAIIYTTPGGQFVLELVDRHGVTFIALAFAIMELAAFSWIYGVKRLVADVQFMLGYKPHKIWQACWWIITPGFMTIVFVYFTVTWTPVEYNNVPFSDFHYAIGWCISALGLSQLPIWMAVAYFRQDASKTPLQRFRDSFKPHPKWGPMNPALNRKYKEYIGANN